MKNTCKILFFLMLSAVIFGGCSVTQNPSPETAAPIFSEPFPEQPPVSSSESASEDPKDIPPKPGMVRSTLTNEWISEDAAKTRPIAVIIPNQKEAIPHYSISKASVIYEAKVEGSLTRMMALFENWKSLKKIGNVRSIRSYFAYWSFEWDAIPVHVGGPYFCYDLLRQENVQSVDGTYDTTAFFRTEDRQAPHNAYVSGDGILQAVNNNHYDLEYRGLTEESHFLFADSSQPNDLKQYEAAAVDATYIDMTEAYPLTRCYFEYNEEDHLYYRYQYLSGSVDGPHIDVYTGRQLCFSNILVQHIITEDIGNGYLAMQCHDTTQEGWFFTYGKGIHVTWKKIGDYGPTRFFDDNGHEIFLNTGKTMILVIKDTDHFSYR